MEEPQSFSIRVNGRVQEATEGTTLGMLAQQWNYHPQTVLIELNKEVFQQKKWKDHPVHEGDQVEFILMVAGG